MRGEGGIQGGEGRRGEGYRDGGDCQGDEERRGGGESGGKGVEEERDTIREDKGRKIKGEGREGPPVAVHS